MIPKTTRLALVALMGMGAGGPRNGPAARKGGNSIKSVSSSKTATLRRGRFSSRRRRSVFFLALRVGRQHITGPLPDVTQLVQFADRGIFPDLPAIPRCQLPAQK